MNSPRSNDDKEYGGKAHFGGGLTQLDERESGEARGAARDERAVRLVAIEEARLCFGGGRLAAGSRLARTCTVTYGHDTILGETTSVVTRGRTRAWGRTG